MSGVGRDNEAWEHYAALRDRFIGLVEALDPDQLATTVPMCPAWTVKDVAAHVCGLNADLASGMTEGLGTDERTAHQVEVRADMTIEEICGEWLAHEVAVSEIFTGTPLWAYRLAADLTIHLHDVQHALGLAIDRDDRFTAAAAHRYADVLQERVRDILGVGIAVELTDGWRAPADPTLEDSGIVLRATPFDFLRSYTSRRSRRQVEALDWTGDPTLVLDRAWSPYGSFPTDDVTD